MSEADEAVLDQYATQLDVAVDVTELWGALADAEGWAGWLADEADVEVVPGGEGRVVDDGEVRVVLVDEVEPLRRVSFTWWPWHDRADRSYVVLEVVPLAAGSRLRITETRLHGAPARARWMPRLCALDLRVCGRSWSGVAALV